MWEASTPLAGGMSVLLGDFLWFGRKLELGWCTETQNQWCTPPHVLMGVCQSCCSPLDHWSLEKKNKKPILTSLPPSVGFTWKKTPTHKFLFLLHSRITHERVWNLWVSVQRKNLAEVVEASPLASERAELFSLSVYPSCFHWAWKALEVFSLWWFHKALIPPVSVAFEDTVFLAQETGTAFSLDKISLGGTQRIYTFSVWAHLS